MFHFLDLRRERGLFALAMTSTFLLAGDAAAVSMLPNPAPWLLPTPTSGEVTLTGVVTGTPIGGTVLDGAVGVGDTTLVLSVSSFTDGIPDFQIKHLLLAATAVGTIAGGGIDIASGALDGFSTTGFFTFGGSGDLAPGETSDEVFVSFASSPVGVLLDFRTAGDLVSLTTATVVPEPGIAWLLVVGGVAVWIARGRER